MISVCMATYNGEKYIREQVDSILAQLGSDDELIVSDDGSSDATLSILRSYGDPRIKLSHNTLRHGVNGNFENALRQAQGDYIFLADQDDVWLPGKVRTCVEALRTTDLVVHDCIVTDSRLKTVHESFFALRGSRSGFWRNWVRNSYVGCCMAFRREILDRVLPIPTRMGALHDCWIGLLAEAAGRTEFLPFAGIRFRRHEQNTSPTAAESEFSLSSRIGYRIGLLRFVLKRIVLKK